MEPTEDYYYYPEAEEEGSMVSYFEYIVDGVLLSIVCIFGIIANMFALFVLCRPQMKSSINCYLQFLAVYDTTFLICKIFLHVMYVFAESYKILQPVYAALYPVPLYYIRVLTYIVRMGSIWTTVGVSVERYIVVCHPLKGIDFCTHKRTVLANFLIGFLVICFNIPHFFVTEIVYHFDNTTNETFAVPTETAFAESFFYRSVYETWMTSMVTSIIPFVALLVLNISIYRRVRKARCARQQMTQKQETDIRLSFLLLCIVIIFLICYTPSFFFGIAESAGFSEQFSDRLPTVLHLTEAINSSVNFIVYCAVGQNFRRMVLRLFSRKKDLGK